MTMEIDAFYSGTKADPLDPCEACARRDDRITRLLRLLEQAEEIVDWVLNPKDELNYTVFASQAAILKAKIEKEKAK